MVSIRWCLKIKNGIELIEPNENISESYFRMAEESLGTIKKVQRESKIWFASTTHYTLYYSLYSVMMRIGIKCEIHLCAIKFMKEFLNGLYDCKEIAYIEDAFEIRKNVQYYPSRLFDFKKLNQIAEKSSDFFIKTKDILVNLTNKDIEDIRAKLKGFKEK